MTTAQFEHDRGGTPVLTVAGTGRRPGSAVLRGPRAETTAQLTGRGKTWRARFPLLLARWGGPALPLPTGEYAIDIDGLEGAPEVLPAHAFEGFRVELRAQDGRAILVVSPATDPAYATAEGQAALERRYVAERPGHVSNAVFFESFYGRNASDNPLALDRAIARELPGIVRYWSVVDASVAVPEGAVAVVEGSPEWWQARASARLLIVNDWLRRAYRRRPGQAVLQTWHGSPLKRLALHRRGLRPRRTLAVIREARRWDVLLAQSLSSATILRRAYAFYRKPVWVEGYPRNDRLVTGDGAETRERLGIGADERVILYAPTWRDDRESIVDFLDLAALAERTGSVVLVRGHTRTIDGGADASGPRVIDVTTYPDTADLLLAADELVTDYSSVMFDFTVTRKPLTFFVPDIERYRGELRGFYFDLEERAPGPMAHTEDELIAVLTNPSAHDAYAERYATWRAVFNAREDGGAADRVLRRLLDQGYLARE